MTFERKFRVLDVPWHIASQYEFAKFPFVDWKWLRQYKRHYSTGVRDDYKTKYNIEEVNAYDPNEVDLVIVRLDQQCFEPGIWDRGKGVVFRDLIEVVGKQTPIIVCMHGTPFYPEMFPPDDPNVGISSQLIEKCKLAVGDRPMVVNSHTAAKQWGFGIPIIHGMDPDEWRDEIKEPRVVTMISAGGLPEYYDRAFLQSVREALLDVGIVHCHITVDWRSESWDDYRNFIGSSLVYFNPTRESPMPRSRTEAMLSGCCVITTPHQDAADFIEDGVNGYLCRRDPQHVVELVQKCFANYKETIAIGQRGKETAKKLFSVERYQKEWYDLMCKTVDEFKKP